MRRCPQCGSYKVMVVRVDRYGCDDCKAEFEIQYKMVKPPEKMRTLD